MYETCLFVSNVLSNWILNWYCGLFHVGPANPQAPICPTHPPRQLTSSQLKPLMGCIIAFKFNWWLSCPRVHDSCVTWEHMFFVFSVRMPPPSLQNVINQRPMTETQSTVSSNMSEFVLIAWVDNLVYVCTYVRLIRLTRTKKNNNWTTIDRFGRLVVWKASHGFNMCAQQIHSSKIHRRLCTTIYIWFLLLYKYKTLKPLTATWPNRQQCGHWLTHRLLAQTTHRNVAESAATRSLAHATSLA